jgi:hypothetical protein
MRGKWSGEAHSQSLTYQVELTFSPGEYFITTSARLPFSNCSGTLALIKQDDTSFTFREHITQGLCTDDTVTLSKIDDSSLKFLARDPLGLILVEGTLHKTK